MVLQITVLVLEVHAQTHVHHRTLPVWDCADGHRNRMRVACPRPQEIRERGTLTEMAASQSFTAVLLGPHDTRQQQAIHQRQYRIVSPSAQRLLLPHVVPQMM